MGTISGFGMDTITLNGTLAAKLSAMREAGFDQVMLMARDLVSHSEGVQGAVRSLRDSGMRATGFQVLRDFEGLSGHLHDYKVDIAKSMLQMCAATGAQTLLACSSSLKHASLDTDHIVADLRKLAMLALPLGIRVAYEALSWGRQVNETEVAYDLICRADCPNLGIGLDSFHLLAAGTSMEIIDELDPERIFLVQLSDFMWQETPSFEERMNTARTYRVFPGEGVHTEQVADMVLRLDRLGYADDYSFEVFNDDYQQLPLDVVAQRARRSAWWLGQEVLQRPVPLPDWTRR
ncbi:MAG: Inosose isomerase [Pseudomonadota bacterium]|jgi:sugar phosphate isomerase/epimerase